MRAIHAFLFAILCACPTQPPADTTGTSTTSSTGEPAGMLSSSTGTTTTTGDLPTTGGDIVSGCSPSLCLNLENWCNLYSIGGRVCGPIVSLVCPDDPCLACSMALEQCTPELDALMCTENVETACAHVAACDCPSTGSPTSSSTG